MKRYKIKFKKAIIYCAISSEACRLPLALTTLNKAKGCLAYNLNALRNATHSDLAYLNFKSS